MDKISDIRLGERIINLAASIHHIVNEPDLNSKREWLIAIMHTLYELVGVEPDESTAHAVSK